MDQSTKKEIELSAVLNLIPYLDCKFSFEDNEPITLQKIVDEYKDRCMDKEHAAVMNIIASAVESNKEYGNIVLVDQSSCNGTDVVTDDLIQACTFKDSYGNYYVSYRGTGDGRWADNGLGMTEQSTEMQEEARVYFDKMAKTYFVSAHENGNRIIITGHSKGGNEAQYVYMTSEYEYLIDNCYSQDGQGFSEKACSYFKDKYGEAYDEKLSRMYSVCGENDYVHDLGYAIIPEDNTYFVKTCGDGFAEYHALENMVADEGGYYTGLQWNTEHGEIIRGEQGEVGALAKELSKKMMQMDDEDLRNAAVSIMALIDIKNERVGSIEIGLIESVDMGFDLLSDGSAVALETLFFTEAGNKFLLKTLDQIVDEVYEKYGVGGVIGAVFIASVFIINVTPLVLNVAKIINVLDYVIDKVNELIETYNKVKSVVAEIREAVVAAINRIIAQIKLLSYGYIYSISNPQIELDTYKLETYAQRLRDVNIRISDIDRRLDSLYWHVGLQDLWDLLKADLLTGYSLRLNRCANYLGDTATDFVNAENDILNMSE